MTACPQCGTANPDGFRLCGMCGTTLPVAVAEQRERRVVSALFADLAGFTRRSESLDVEDVEGFLDPYFAVLRGEVERTGGLVAKFTGDGVMALFGALTAHEDDPERAVRCGLEICERVGELAGQLHVRVGITTGEAMVTLPTDGHPDAIGDVINTAARLEAAAPTDGVLVDAWTYRATRRAITYEEHEAIAAKGKAEPVEVWVARAPISIIPEQQRDRLPLVGRDVEVDTLRAAFGRSSREPSTQLISVIGEPGIGKTRLVEELHAHIDELPELITWRRGRSLAYGEGIAFWALGEMVKAQAGILESDSADIAGQRLAVSVEALGLEERDRVWVTRHLGPLVGLEATAGSDSSRVEAFAAWRRFVEALAEDGPTVLIFEDIHWADDALLDFIDLLAERSGAVPLLIVCTARPEILERRPGWAGGKTNTTTISLNPLSDGDTARLVGGLLDQTTLPVDVQQPLLAQASGNPLYAQEYVRMLQDRNVLVRGEAGWTLEGAATELPESIQGIIAARLDTLSADEKSLLHDAAVIGRTAWLGAVCALTERNLWEADELLHGLERKQLVQRARRSSIQGETEFVFGHELTKDVAYSQIRRAHRAQKHEAAAAWIEQLAGERDDKAELLADHYGQAFSLREAMGEDTTAIAARARAALTEAAHQAAATYAHTAAARHFEAALALTPLDDTTNRAALLLGQARANYSADAHDQASLITALDAQVEAEEWEGAAEVERMLAKWYAVEAGSPSDAAVHRARGAEYAARVPPSSTMCHIAADEAFALILSGRATEAAELAREKLHLAHSAGLGTGLGHLMMVHGLARIGCGDVGGVDDLRAAAEVLSKTPAVWLVNCYGNLAENLRGLGDMAAADATYSQAGEWASRLGQPSLIDWIAIEQSYQAYHAADWNTTERLLGQVGATASQMDLCAARIVRGRVALGRDDAASALAHAVAVVAYGESTSNDEFLLYGLALEAGSRHGADALGATTRFLTRWHDAGGYPGRALELCEVANVLATHGNHEQIRDAALLLSPDWRWRDALLQVADERYAEAAALYQDFGSLPLAAGAHLLAADQASRQGRLADAAVYANAVLGFAKQAGALLYQRQADQLIAASA